MTKNPSRRLGVSGGAGGIRAHAFFRDVDWPALQLRRLRPPFRPKLVSGAGPSGRSGLASCCVPIVVG